MKSSRSRMKRRVACGFLRPSILLTVDVGFVNGRPRERDFAIELEAEITRLEDFLSGPKSRVKLE